MDELLDLLIEVVGANGGVMEYPAMLEQVPGEQRSRIPNALRLGKSEGTLRKRIRVVDGRPVHEVYLPTASA